MALYKAGVEWEDNRLEQGYSWLLSQIQGHLGRKVNDQNFVVENFKSNLAV